jgi:uncharacterized protein (DUF1330 family)
MTFIPSVFGQNQLKFDDKEDVTVCTQDDYYNFIIKMIDDQLATKKPVLVFFENEEKMMAFFNLPKFSELKQNFNPYVLSEKASSEHKEFVIK